MASKVPGLNRPPGGWRDGLDEELVGRNQALRAKMAKQGCTEQEALAAAEKGAALLDRHDLSLSELDLKRQACEGVSAETGRRRVGAVNNGVPAVAASFDRQAWGERSASGTLRHVFFGLPADVAAARHPHEPAGRSGPGRRDSGRRNLHAADPGAPDSH